MNRSPISRVIFRLIPPASMMALLLATSACVYKVDVQQGNVVSEEQISQLALGMSKEQVITILGSPMLIDPFHTDRWDYYTWSKTGRQNKEISQTHTRLQFKDGRLANIE